MDDSCYEQEKLHLKVPNNYRSKNKRTIFSLFSSGSGNMFRGKYYDLRQEYNKVINEIEEDKKSPLN